MLSLGVRQAVLDMREFYKHVNLDYQDHQTQQKEFKELNEL